MLAAGKAKVAKNALRHGREINLSFWVLSQEIEELAELIARRNVAPYLLIAPRE